MPNDRYLTSYRFAIDRDGFADPEFAATERDDFRQTIRRYEDVDITGQVVVGGLAALAVIAMVVVALRRRRRSA